MVCPRSSGTEAFKAIAWEDQQLNLTDRQGLMHCYCLKELTLIGPDVIDITFTQFMKLNKTSGKMGPDQTKYCEEWFFNYAAQ